MTSYVTLTRKSCDSVDAVTAALDGQQDESVRARLHIKYTCANCITYNVKADSGHKVGRPKDISTLRDRSESHRVLCACVLCSCMVLYRYKIGQGSMRGAHWLGMYSAK